jgi:peptide/nickel transport system ATP-binding protein
MMGQALLSVRDLAVDFHGDGAVTHAVRGVSFDVFAGRTLAIVGESGSGKSVSAQAILGILSKRGRIAGGSILFRDPRDGSTVDIAALGQENPAMRALRGGRIAMIFQEPMTSLSVLHTVGDQVSEALLLHRPCSPAEARQEAEALFAKVGFPNPAKTFDSYPFELSGGQRQRAMIAMALICRPALLIADEPTTALDVTTQAQILDLIASLRDEFGMGVMLITHDLGVVANMADDVVVMYRGRVMEAGSRAEIFGAPEHPYLRALMQAVPHLDMARDERLKPLREVRVEAGKGLLAVKETPGKAPRPPVGAPVLVAEHVSKSFELRSGWFGGKTSRVQALTDVSLTLRSGRTLGLVGESGSGKTTLSKIITRAIDPDHGTVMYDDGSGAADIRSFRGERLLDYRRAVQFVFQDPFASLNPRMTVGDILMEPLRIHKVGEADEHYDRATNLLALVGLGKDAMRRYPHSFSGGQRQRLGLARALALSPAIIICDEPTSALDVSVQAQVLNLFRDLQQALQLSYLFVTHNLAVVDYMADEIAVLCKGHLVEFAPRDALFRQPQHPYTRALLAACPTPDLERPLDFAALRAGGFSDPARWPAPFTIHAQHADADGDLIEVRPGHFVRHGSEFLGSHTATQPGVQPAMLKPGAALATTGEPSR